MSIELHFSRSGDFMGMLYLPSIQEARDIQTVLVKLGYSVTIIDDINNNIVNKENI